MYRIRTDDSGRYVERFEPLAGSWAPGPGTFLRFVNEGELGADEISAEEAKRLILLLAGPAAADLTDAHAASAPESHGLAAIRYVLHRSYVL